MLNYISFWQLTTMSLFQRQFSSWSEYDIRRMVYLWILFLLDFLFLQRCFNRLQVSWEECFFHSLEIFFSVKVVKCWKHRSSLINVAFEILSFLAACPWRFSFSFFFSPHLLPPLPSKIQRSKQVSTCQGKRCLSIAREISLIPSFKTEVVPEVFYRHKAYWICEDNVT